MPKTSLRSYVVGPVATNCYFLINEDTSEALIIDPGAEADRLAEELARLKLTTRAILLTHGHFEHVSGVPGLKKHFKELVCYAGEKEKATLSDPEKNLSTLFTGVSSSYQADEFLRDGQEMTLAGMKFRVLFTPGHTEGGVSYYFPNEYLVFSGDTLFCGSVGRTDFPGGSMSAIVRSCSEVLMQLPDFTRVLTGHDAETTIEREKISNPYF